MRRRGFFWLALGITLLVPFVLMVLTASFSVTEFAILSAVIVVVALSLLGRYFLAARRRLHGPPRAGVRPAYQPALIIGLGVLALAFVGVVATLAIAGPASPAAPALQTPVATQAATPPSGPREVPQSTGLVGALVGVVVGLGIVVAAYLVLSQRQPPEPDRPETPVEMPGLDWQQMLAPEDDNGDDSDVTWWVQKLTDKDDRR